jgi:ketosteroid isomerase-like protein
MKSILFYPVLLLLIHMTTIHVLAQSVTKVDEHTELVLNKFRTDYSKSMLDGKIERLQRYFTDTIRLMPPFQKTVLGKVNAFLYYRALTNKFNIHTFTRHEIEILDLGQQVMEIGEITMRMTLKSTGKEFNIAAKYLNLWAKTSGGELRLLTEAWNGDQYYAELHDQLRFDDVPSVHIAFQSNVPITNDIRFELAALNKLLDATVTQHDGNTWSLYYSDDAKLLASYHPIFNGKKAIDDYIQAHVKELPTFEELDIRNDRVDDLGNYIVEYASHVASWKSGNSSGLSLGKNIRIWRRESNHALKLFRAIGTYD